MPSGRNYCRVSRRLILPSSSQACLIVVKEIEKIVYLISKVGTFLQQKLLFRLVSAHKWHRRNLQDVIFYVSSVSITQPKPAYSYGDLARIEEF